MIEENPAEKNVNKPEGGKKNGGLGDLRGVFITGAWGFIALVLVAAYWPNLTERMKFFMGTLWVLVTTFAVIAQAVIYRKQWRVMNAQWQAMERQETTMRDQVRIASDSLKISQRAYVGVHSLREDFENDRVIMLLENVGNIPAEFVRVNWQAWIVRSKGLSLALSARDVFEFSPVCHSGYEFGKVKLFRGNLKAQAAIYLLNITLKDKTFISSAIDGHGTLWITGRIEYDDGFERDRITEFAFIYDKGEWMVRGVDLPKQGEDNGQAEKKANPN